MNFLNVHTFKKYRIRELCAKYFPLKRDDHVTLLVLYLYFQFYGERIFISSTFLWPKHTF